MHKGKVKFFNEAKGFGFIVDSDSGKEYFVHVSGLINEIREGDDVSFELEEGASVFWPNVVLRRLLRPDRPLPALVRRPRVVVVEFGSRLLHLDFTEVKTSA